MTKTMRSNTCNDPLNEIIGNEKTKDILLETIRACKITKKPMPNILLSGNSGCGKTTIARKTAESAEKEFYHFYARQINDDIETFIQEIKTLPESIIFIDETHQLNKGSQESFFPILDEGKITIVAATTDKGKLLRPFKNRFSLSLFLSKYNEAESTQICLFYCKKLGYNITPESAIEIAKRGRGVARTIEKIVDGCHRKSILNNSKTITLDSCLSYFDQIGIDELGLTPDDRKVISVLFKHKKLSLNALLALTEIDPEEYGNFIEPYLFQSDLISISSRGRIITDKGTKYAIKNV